MRGSHGVSETDAATRDQIAERLIEVDALRDDWAAVIPLSGTKSGLSARRYWAQGKTKLLAEVAKLDNDAAESLATMLVAAAEEQARSWGPKAGAEKLTWVKQKAAEKGIPLTDENIAAAVRMLKSAGMEATE